MMSEDVVVESVSRARALRVVNECSGEAYRAALASQRKVIRRRAVEDRIKTLALRECCVCVTLNAPGFTDYESLSAPHMPDSWILLAADREALTLRDSGYVESTKNIGRYSFRAVRHGEIVCVLCSVPGSDINKSAKRVLRNIVKMQSEVCE